MLGPQMPIHGCPTGHPELLSLLETLPSGIPYMLIIISAHLSLHQPAQSAPVRLSLLHPPSTPPPPHPARSAILAHWILNEKLNLFGMLGCLLCIVGSMTIVLHAPPEREIHSVLEVWALAMQPCEWQAQGSAFAVLLMLQHMRRRHACMCEPAG